MAPRIFRASSINCASRKESPVLATIIHYDAAPSGRGSIDWMCNPVSKVSAHFQVSRRGDITQIVPLETAAWHAGTAVLRDTNGSEHANVNSCTIGIELGNLGRLERGPGGLFYYMDGDKRLPYAERMTPILARLRFNDALEIEGYWEPYPVEQIAALKELLAWIGSKPQYSAAASSLFGHDEVAVPMGRKNDPGPLFPWHEFQRATPRSLSSTVVG